MDSSPARQACLSVIVPVFNEQDVLAAFHARLSAVLDNLSCDFQIIYVNDGSEDGSVNLISNFHDQDGRVELLDLSRNFGKEIAMTAGFDHAVGDAVVVIDADLQDPPELIPELYRYYQEGYDVVYAQRVSRAGEGPLKKVTAFLFYRLIQAMTRVQIPADTGD